MNDVEKRVEELRRRTEALDDAAFLRAVTAELDGRILFASSLGAEDQVVTSLLRDCGRPVPIVTLDTGRLPQETYDLIERTRSHFSIEIEMLFPEAAAVEALTGAGGPNLFYNSIEDRKACCRVRKVEPLRRRLAGFDAWITGLRREQSPTRSGLERVEYDASNRIIKINPLAAWTSDAVWSYVRDHGLPYNELHDRGYPSIGCAPCTRAVRAGEDERAGRWWWEMPEQKECGIHIQDGRVTRIGKRPLQGGDD